MFDNEYIKSIRYKKKIITLLLPKFFYQVFLILFGKTIVVIYITESKLDSI